jgi:hypothetical protein
MKTKMTKVGLIIAATVAQSMPAWAGFGAHGGNGIVCFNDPAIPTAIRREAGAYSPLEPVIIPDQYISQITSIEVVDLNMARRARGPIGEIKPEIILPNAGETPSEYVERIAQRFDQSVPLISEIIRSGVKSFPIQNIIEESWGLKPVNDSRIFGLIDSTNCVAGTMATQYVSGGQTYLHIDARLTRHEKGDPLNPYILYLHEIVYSEGVKRGHRDSRNTQILVEAMIQSNVPRTLQQLVDLVKSLHFSSYEEERRPSFPERTVFSVLKSLAKYTQSQVHEQQKRPEVAQLIRSADQLLKETQLYWDNGYTSRGCSILEYCHFFMEEFVRTFPGHLENRKQIKKWLESYLPRLRTKIEEASQLLGQTKKLMTGNILAYFESTARKPIDAIPSMPEPIRAKLISQIKAQVEERFVDLGRSRWLVTTNQRMEETIESGVMPLVEFDLQYESP